MFHRAAKTIQSQARPFGILAAGLILVAIITAVGGFWHYRSVLGQHPSDVTPKTTGTLSAAHTLSASNSITADNSKSSPNATSSQANRPSPNTGAGAATSSPLPATSNSQNPILATVSLSVNGIHKGNITLPNTSKQCEVLTQALKDGLISSLTMPYDAQYKSYGVYVIDGIGDPTTVWWTYQVNGKSPPSGCSYLTVHDGDAVNWQYIKS